MRHRAAKGKGYQKEGVPAAGYVCPAVSHPKPNVISRYLLPRSWPHPGWWKFHPFRAQIQNLGVLLDSSLFLTPTSNSSANPVGSTFEADPECSSPHISSPTLLQEPLAALLVSVLTPNRLIPVQQPKGFFSDLSVHVLCLLRTLQVSPSPQSHSHSAGHH